MKLVDEHAVVHLCMYFKRTNPQPLCAYDISTSPTLEAWPMTPVTCFFCIARTMRQRSIRAQRG